MWDSCYFGEPILRPTSGLTERFDLLTHEAILHFRSPLKLPKTGGKIRDFDYGTSLYKAQDAR